MNSTAAPAVYPDISHNWAGENNCPLNSSISSIPRAKSGYILHPPSAHHVLHLGQTSLPAVVDEPQHDDDGADGADDHQHHEELPIITACLVRVRLAACGGRVVLDTNLEGKKQYTKSPDLQADRILFRLSRSKYRTRNVGRGTKTQGWRLRLYTVLHY